MASVFVRAGNRWYARIKSRDGKWISRRVRQQTRKDALRVARTIEADEEQIRLGLKAAPQRGELCSVLMKRWGAQLDNRARDTDLCRLDLHVLPRWKAVPVAAVDLPKIMAWLDDMAAADQIGPGSQRHCLGLLSRFLSWCVARGLVERNVARDVPTGRRPRAPMPQPETVPWVRSDGEAITIMRALDSPWAEIFFLGNRSGLRLGEILGLQLGDLDALDVGAIRVAHSYAGPLKEDRRGEGKVKWCPATADTAAVLAPIIAQRRASGAGPADRLFVDQDGDPIDRHAVAYRWRVARTVLGLPAGLSFYKGTRHSFASRALASGADLAEVSAALGHASPAITLKHYIHHVRRTFSPILRTGLGLDGAPGAKVIPLSAHNQATETAAPPAPATKEGDHHAA